MKDPTRAPFYAALYHGLCVIARKHGYALAIHGTVTSDLDLIAVPWVADAGDPVTLKDALMQHISALDYGDVHRRMGLTEETVQQIVEQHEKNRKEIVDSEGATIKPHGRRAWNLYMDFGAKVDLSILPRQTN